MDLQHLIDFDRELLHVFNGSDSLFLDGLMTTFTSPFTWIPLYLCLFYLVVRNSENNAQIWLIVGCVALCVLLAGGVDDWVVKPWVARWRPCHDPVYKATFRVVEGCHAGSFGFFSAHSANTFSIALFFSLLVRKRAFTVAMVAWSLLNAYTRMYLALHYPGDILCGLLWGACVGMACYALYRHVYRRFSPQISYVSSHYTTTSYSHADINFVFTVLALTLCYAALKSVYLP